MSMVCITVVTLLSFAGLLGAAFAMAGFAAVDYGRAREKALAARARLSPIAPRPPGRIVLTGTPRSPVPRSGRNLS
jgi:hypothetical protein